MRNWLQRYWRQLLVAVIPAGIFLPFLKGLGIASYDTTHIFYVGKRWFWDHVLQGHFPLWNEHVYTGFNQLASPANGWLSPISAVFYLIIPNVWAELLQLPLFAAVAGLGMFFWLREWTGSRDAALLGGLAFALCGPLLSLPDRSHHFYALALYPTACFLSLRIFNVRGAIGFLACTIAMIIMHADWAGAGLLSMALLISARDKKHLRATAIAVVWGFALAALTFVPALTGIREMTRASGFTFEQSSLYSLHPLRLLNFVLPEAWGQPWDGTFYGHSIANAYMGDRFWFHSIFAGVPILILAFLGLRPVLARGKFAWALLALALICLLTAFGQHFFLHGMWHKYFPFYSSLRFPEKFIVWFMFGIFPLAAFAAAKMEKWRNLFFAAAFIHAIAFAAYFLWPELGAKAIPRFQVAHVLLVVAYVTLAIYPKFILPGPLLVAILVTVELLTFAPAQRWVDAERIETRSWLKLKDGRYLRDGNLNKFDVFGLSRRGFQPNWTMLDGHRDVFGYDAITPTRTEKLAGTGLFKTLDSWLAVLNITNVITTIQPRATDLNRLAEKGYLQVAGMDKDVNGVLLEVPRPNRNFITVCRHQIVEGEDAAFEAVQARGPTIEPLIIESKNAPPIATQECGKPEVKEISRTPEHRIYEINSESAVWFVERESFSEGWTATMDGQNTEIFRADFITRAIYVPAGTHKIEMSFTPPGFLISASISAISFLVLIAYFLVSFCFSQSFAHFKKTE